MSDLTSPGLPDPWLKTTMAVLADFAAERDWQQFHTPKNLAAGVAVEAGELLELFLWATPEESSAVQTDNEKLAAVGQEIADVLIYLLRLADVLGIDLEAAVAGKIGANAERYTVSAFKGSAAKAPPRKGAGS